MLRAADLAEKWPQRAWVALVVLMFLVDDCHDLFTNEWIGDGAVDSFSSEVQIGGDNASAYRPFAR